MFASPTASIAPSDYADDSTPSSHASPAGLTYTECGLPVMPVCRLDGHRTLDEALSRQTFDLNVSADDAERFHAEALPIVRRLIQLGLLARPHQDPDA